jgi:hypothetical protein
MSRGSRSVTGEKKVSEVVMRRSLGVALLLAGCTTPTYYDPPTDDLPGGGDDPTSSAPAAPAAAGEASSVTLSLAPPRSRRGGDTPPRCLDGGDGGVLGEASATAVSVRIRSLTLVGGEGTDDHALIATTAYDDADSLNLSTSGKTLDVAAIPVGTYVGLELSLWTVEANLPMQLPGVSGARHTVSMWYASTDAVSARDVTVRVSGEEHWIDLESGEAVAVDGWEAPGAPPDDEDFVDWETGPAERLRLRGDAAMWAADPAVLSSLDGELVFATDTGDGTMVVTEGDVANIDIVFQPLDTMRWWEGPVGTDTVAADGIYDPTEDCGLDVRVPGVSAVGWTEGADTGE